MSPACSDVSKSAPRRGVAALRWLDGEVGRTPQSGNTCRNDIYICVIYTWIIMDILYSKIVYVRMKNIYIYIYVYIYV